MNEKSRERPANIGCDETQLARKVELEAQRARDSIIAGYRDAIAGRADEFRGDLRSLLKNQRDI